MRRPRDLRDEMPQASCEGKGVSAQEKGTQASIQHLELPAAGENEISCSQVSEALTIVISLFGSSALSLTLVYLARTWISERLKASIEHECARKFELFKSQLSLESEKELARVT